MQTSGFFEFFFGVSHQSAEKYELTARLSVLLPQCRYGHLAQGDNLY